MVLARIGIIGGSGLYKMADLKDVEELEIQTPFGSPSAPILELKLKTNEHTFFFLPRHGLNHQFSPSEVNYRANIYALKQLGARSILSLSAVGSLQEQYRPGDFVFVDQMLDMTKGIRKRSFFETGLVGHVSAAYPIYIQKQKYLWQEANQILDEKNIHLGGTYLCVEGPQFSSRAESQLYRSWGASVIGMTNVPESYLASEAGLAYTAISGFVS